MVTFKVNLQPRDVDGTLQGKRRQPGRTSPSYAASEHGNGLFIDSGDGDGDGDGSGNGQRRRLRRRQPPQPP